MEKLKNFFTDINKNIILGIIGCVCCTILNPTLVFSLLFLLYFIFTFQSLKGKKTKALKLKKIIGILLLIQIIFLPFALLFSIFDSNLQYILPFCFLFIWAIYICGILNNKLLFNNKIYLIDTFLLVIFYCIANQTIMDSISVSILYLLTMPYFYNYYNILKEAKNNEQ